MGWCREECEQWDGCRVPWGMDWGWIKGLPTDRWRPVRPFAATKPALPGAAIRSEHARRPLRRRTLHAAFRAPGCGAGRAGSVAAALADRHLPGSFGSRLGPSRQQLLSSGRDIDVLRYGEICSWRSPTLLTARGEGRLLAVAGTDRQTSAQERACEPAVQTGGSPREEVVSFADRTSYGVHLSVSCQKVTQANQKLLWAGI